MGVRLIPSFHNSKLETENEHANFDARFNCMLDGVNVRLPNLIIETNADILT